MSHPIISVRNIGKRYELGETIRHDTLRDRLAYTAKKFLGGSGAQNGQPSTSPAEFWALRDVSFDINPGEVVGIIGRNGAGKSTLLKILSQITEPTTGEIRLRGRIASLLEVGTGFHPELTGRENVFLNGAILGMSQAEIKKKFDEIVAFAEIEKFLDTPVKRYSSGMYVRLAFAVAAHLDPEILIVDEVLAVGDVRFQEKCLGKMQNVANNEGRTVLFVSHQLASLSKLCTRGIVMSAGQVSMDGTVSKAIEHYISGLGNREGEMKWKDLEKAPGNHIAKITAVRLLSDEKITSEVKTGSETVVEIDYVCQTGNEAVSCSIHLLDNLGSCILATGNMPSVNTIEDVWANKNLPIGTYRTRCVIPANFLNECSYGISAFLVHNNSKILAKAENVLSFIAHDSGEMRKEYSGPWIGSIRPKMAWSTEVLSH
ncbi:MAG TPA: ABC transporter ATP-binding protein [Verrucomicrobiae bacterium]